MRILIIGAGPGGYETAAEAAKRGFEVTLVTEGPFGGTCLNEGCIPTKTLVHCDGTLAEAQARKAEVVSQLRAGVASLLSNKLITVVQGHAAFRDAKTVVVDGNAYTADKFIIATGSVPAVLPVPGADRPSVLDSTRILALEEVPARLCVIGGGVIGLEFASIFRKFGAEVTVVEYAKEVLPNFDSDLAKRLRLALKARGIAVETGACVTEIGDGFVRYEKKGETVDVPCDKVLMAVGRRPRVDDLGLEAAGVTYSRRGVAVDDNLQTNVPDIYAIGDVNARLMLAHVATFQGRRALNHIQGLPDRIRFDLVPGAVFTVPEAASVGLSEDAAKERGMAVKCLKSFYRANGKAVSMGETEGYCKWVTDAESGKILGCHLLGAHSSDLVHEATVLLNFGASVDDLKNIIHAHPTLSEVLESAVLS
ncbi:MAG: FAD-dependent oxidoreductase [Bacteroidales bacterium]|nr:FAD-dependent oxidoreductase [Bacteroidales bacterium]